VSSCLQGRCCLGAPVDWASAMPVHSEASAQVTRTSEYPAKLAMFQPYRSPWRWASAVPTCQAPAKLA
jgi:hypothetical protein